MMISGNFINMVVRSELLGTTRLFLALGNPSHQRVSSLSSQDSAFEALRGVRLGQSEPSWASELVSSQDMQFPTDAADTEGASMSHQVARLPQKINVHVYRPDPCNIQAPYVHMSTAVLWWLMHRTWHSLLICKSSQFFRGELCEGYLLLAELLTLFRNKPCLCGDRTDWFLPKAPVRPDASVAASFF